MTLFAVFSGLININMQITIPSVFHFTYLRCLSSVTMVSGETEGRGPAVGVTSLHGNICRTEESWEYSPCSLSYSCVWLCTHRSTRTEKKSYKVGWVLEKKHFGKTGHLTFMILADINYYLSIQHFHNCLHGLNTNSMLFCS